MTTQTPDSKPRALIAMSGGVDSSVAAWLMQQAGYESGVCVVISSPLVHSTH